MSNKLVYEFWNSRDPLKFNPSQLWDHASSPMWSLGVSKDQGESLLVGGG